jgi:DNA-binding transcriptional MerR regulator
LAVSKIDHAWRRTARTALEKAPDAFRTISEVADEIDVPQHVLRFWESRFPQIRPMKRGGGRRYYRPDDVDLLRGVRHLLYGEGYTIRGVQRILREQGGGFVQSVWRVDAEPPPPELEEDRAADDDVTELAAAGRSEPNLFGLRPAAHRATDADERSEPRTEAGPGIESPTRRLAALENRRKLQSALDELVVCRGIIDAAFRQQ